ncbi:MAG: hypothetical protein A2Z29_07790 [Chloroflexi bacterium RBG_16_56_11]|nr:MAG: hypothetical protein A2Z29_07790 [Chloroflexi bacterium RBG_16_56_11]
MIPRHCRQVSVRRVAFPLNKKNILEAASKKPAYATTNYMVLNSGADWMVLKVEKVLEQGLFRKIEGVEIISMPGDTGYVEKPEVDVNNPSLMVRMAEQVGKDALVVKGKFEHISFVYKEKTTPIVVFDVVPPKPPKIIELVEAALSTGRIKKPIRIIPKIVDLNEMARTRNTRYVMFPCYAVSLAGLEGGQNALYLDQAQGLKVPASEITLVGCELSLRIFTSLYGEKPAFIDHCPKKLLHTVSEAALCRCCVVDEGHEIEGNAAYVPWGASVGEVEEAIIDLFRLEIDDYQQDEIIPEEVQSA